MKLSEGRMGETYLVQEVSVAPNITRRLEALGVNGTTHIQIMNRKQRGTVIIKVRGTWLALGAGIASGITIAEVAS